MWLVYVRYFLHFIQAVIIIVKARFDRALTTELEQVSS